MGTPHKHAEIIKAWADGAIVQYSGIAGQWITLNDPCFSAEGAYRIKPEPKPDVVRKIELTFDDSGICGTFKFLDVPDDTNHKAN